MIKKYFLPIFIIFAFLTISLFAQDELDATVTEYIAKIVDFNVLIDGEQLLTSNPVVIINGNIYIPIEMFANYLELNKNFEIQQIRNVDYSTTMFSNIKSLEITTDAPITDVDDRITKVLAEKQIESVVSKLTLGMTFFEVYKLMGKPPLLNPYSSNTDVRYYFSDAGFLTLRFDAKVTMTRAKHDLLFIEYMTSINSDFDAYIDLTNNEIIEVAGLSSAIINELDLFAKEYTAKSANFPVFIDGEEFLTSNQIVIIGYNNVYVSIVEFAEILGIIVSFNKEKTQLEITKR